MIKLSKSMKEYLKKKKLNSDTKAVKTTIEALKKRGLCQEEGNLTEQGEVVAVSLLPLSMQCHFLNIPLEEVTLQYSGCPEVAVLKYLSFSSKPAYFSENTFGVDVGQFFMFKFQYDMATKNDMNLYSIGFTHNDCTRKFIYEELLKSLEHKLSKLNNDTIAENYQLILKLNKQYESASIVSTNNVSTTEQRDGKNHFLMTYFFQETWDIDFYKNIYLFLGVEFIRNLIKLVICNPYRYAAGWPDLIVLGDKPHFIEVKTTDRFSVNQIVTTRGVIQGCCPRN